MQLFQKSPGGFDLYMQIEAWILRRHPGAQIRPKKTQVGFFEGCGFAWVSPPLRKGIGVTLTLGLPERLSSPRVLAATEPYPGRWTHHIPVFTPEDLDDELGAWLDDAHAFALSRRR